MLNGSVYVSLLQSSVTSLSKMKLLMEYFYGFLQLSLY